MRNRSLIALSAVGIHLSIGSVYAFSVLVRPIMETLGASMGDVTWTFSLAILFLGMSAALLGRFVEKIGPQKSGLMAAFFFGTGLWVRRMPFPSEAFPSSISFMGALAALVLAQATSHPYQPW